MLIGIDGIPLATLKSGIGHYTLELASALAVGFPEHFFQLIAPVAVELEPDSLPSNLAVIQVPVNALRRRWWTIGLPLYVRQNRLTLYHGTNYNIPLWRRCPTVVTIHDLSLLLYPETHREDLVLRARRRLPTMTRLAAHVITDSESVKREITEHLGIPAQKITAVPLAPRRAFQRMDPQEAKTALQRLGIEEQFILFVGTVEPRKNLITLIRAFDALMRETDLRPQLVIAGQKGWLTDELYASVDHSALKDRVLFTGYVSDTDLRALYSSCQASVYPSLYEGFGLPPLEAMACGAPVITSRIPVIMETSEGAAVLIDPVSTSELTAALAELLSSSSKRRELREAGLRRAGQYTWEITARRTFEVYQRVLDPRAGKLPDI
jgi:glycosyltransferase involved in cell wall biosynthesis